MATDMVVAYANLRPCHLPYRIPRCDDLECSRGSDLPTQLRKSQEISEVAVAFDAASASCNGGGLCSANDLEPVRNHPERGKGGYAFSAYLHLDSWVGGLS